MNSIPSRFPSVSREEIFSDYAGRFEQKINEMRSNHTPSASNKNENVFQKNVQTLQELSAQLRYPTRPHKLHILEKAAGQAADAITYREGGYAKESLSYFEAASQTLGRYDKP